MDGHLMSNEVLAVSTTDRHDVRDRLARSGVLGSWRTDGADPDLLTVAGIAKRLVALGAEDADLGWIGAVAAVTNLAVADLPESGLRQVWTPGGETLVCGTLAPQGTGGWIDGAFHVNAISSPASGLPWADWVMATVRDVETEALVRVFVPVSEVRIERTWEAAGLRGSGSDTAHLEDVVVPADRARVLVPAPGSAPLPFFASIFFAAPLIGTVQAALDHVLGAAADGRPRWERRDVRSTIGSARRRVDRAVTLFAGAIGRLGTKTQVDSLSDLDRAVATDLAVQALAEAEGALPLLMSGSGGDALHASHPVARAVRDVGTGARHTALSPAKSADGYDDALFTMAN